MGTSTVHCVIVCEAMISCDILLFSGLKNRKAVMLCHAHLFRFSGFFQLDRMNILNILNK